MTASIDVARDDMFTAFKTVWDAGAEAIIGEVPTAYWDGVGVPEEPDPSSPYVIPVIRHNPDTNHLLSADGTNVSRVEFFGVMIIAIRVPVTAGGAAVKAVKLGRLALTAFAGTTTSNHVWFRNPAVVEAGVDGHFYQVTATVSFEYDDFF